MAKKKNKHDQNENVNAKKANVISTPKNGTKQNDEIAF